MKVLLKKSARITHQPGEIVEVSPATWEYLRSTGSAVLAEEKTENKAKKTKAEKVEK